MLPIRCWRMRSSTSPQIFSGEAEEAVEGVVDRALGGVLDRHHAEIGAARLDLVKHLVDGGERQRAHRVTEVIEHRASG